MSNGAQHQTARKPANATDSLQGTSSSLHSYLAGQQIKQVKPHAKQQQLSWAERVAKSGQQNENQAVKRKPATNAKAAIKRAAARAIQPRTEPLEFERVHFRLNDSRPLKRCTNAREAQNLLWNIVAKIKIREAVVAVSKIGNSVLEIYIPSQEKDRVIKCLDESKLEVLTDYDLCAVPVYGNQNVTETLERRLVHMYRQAKLGNLRKCILTGLPKDMADRIAEKATTDLNATVTHRVTFLPLGTECDMSGFYALSHRDSKTKSALSSKTQDDTS